MMALSSALVLILALPLLAAPPPASLDQVKAESNPEHRAKDAVEFAATAERDAESAYDKGDGAALRTELKTMQDAVELARQALENWGKSANHHPGPYKFAETHTHDILVRLNDFEHRMDESERPLVDGPRNRLQQIHDAWFEAIMERKR